MSARNRPINVFGPNEQGLVDKFIGTAYDTVQLVAQNMDHIVFISGIIDNLPANADAVFKEAVEKYMPAVYIKIDEYTESKKPQIDEYINGGLITITNHTN